MFITVAILQNAFDILINPFIKHSLCHLWLYIQYGVHYLVLLLRSEKIDIIFKVPLLIGLRMILMLAKF